MEYVQMTLDNWLEMKEALDREFRLQQASFIKAGYLLRQIEKTKAYEMDGKKSLAEWAKDRYGLSPSTVSKYKHINEAFSLGGNSDKLDPQYIGYGFSKLTDMLALPDRDLEQLSPDMPRADIRALKAFNKEVGELPEEPTDMDKVVKLFWEKYPNAIEEILHQQAFSLDQFKECVIPSGYRTFLNSTAGYYAMFDEQTVKYRKGQGKWIFVTWEEFMDASRPYMEVKHEDHAEEDPVSDPGMEVDHVHTGSDIPDTEAEEPQGREPAQAPAEDREPVEEEKESERDTVEDPGEEPDADPSSAGGGMESGSGPARSGSGQAMEDVEPGPDHTEHEEPDSEGSLPAEDDNESVLLAPSQLADDESEAGEAAEEAESLSDSMNEPEEEPETEEERVAPAQLAATSRAKIYLGNVQSAMEAGAWKRALSSCEELMHALQKVVYG
jgi:hypothetical protein